MRVNRYALAMLTLVFSSAFVAAQPRFEDVVKKVEAKFEPAEAKPGQTVTLKISVQLVSGWHTYPLVQPEKAAKQFTNKLTFPTDGPIVYVGEVEDPSGYKEKSEPIAMIEKMRVYPGGAAWERKAVVLPTAQAGAASSKLKFKVLVCDKDNCLPPKTLELEASLKVAGAAVPVDPKFKEEVEKAQKK